MKFKFSGILPLFLLYSTIVSAQNHAADAHLTGHVVDVYTKEHIPFATVGISGTTVGVMTDATGHFFIKNLPQGEYTMVASRMGYHSSEQSIRIEHNITQEIKFDLTPDIIEVDEVVVSGSRNEINRRESSTIVSVLSSRIFERTAANSVADVLNFQSGLRVEQTCSNCGVPQLRINGLEGQYSQILLDSRPIFSSLAGVYGLEQVPAGMIQRVEVIRGGGSALFGSSAIAGVVNIITKEPLHNSITLSNNSGATEKGTKEINTTLNGSFVSDDHRAGVYLFGMIRDRDAYDRDGDGFSESPLLSSETMGFRGYYKITTRSKLTAEYHHMREYRRGGDRLDRPPHEADIAEELRHRINGGGVKYDFLSHKDRFSLYSSLQYIDRGSYFGTAQNLNAYGHTKDFTLVSGGQYTHSFSKLLLLPAELTAGLESTHNQLEDKMLGYHRLLEQTSLCHGVFVQNEWKNERWGVLIGGRLDQHNKVKNPIINPRFNLRYTPTGGVRLRASYSSGYRAPQAYDEDLHVAAVGGQVAIITLSPTLKPEYSNSLSGSVDLYKSLARVETNLLIEGFYTDIKDVFTLEENGFDANNNLMLERRNSPGAVVQGINLDLKLGFTPKLVTDLGFTFQHSRYKELYQWSQDPAIAAQRKMFRSPDQYGYVMLNYLPLRRLTLSLSGNYTGPMLVQHYGAQASHDWEKQTPDFFDMGFRVAYDLSLSAQTTMQLSAGVKNLLDQYQRDLDRGIDKDAGYIYGPAVARFFYLGVKFTL